MKDFLTNLVVFLGTLVLIGFIALLLGFPVMWLWNWIMPAIFALPRVTFWQAVGINLLCGFLFRTTVSK